MTFPDRPKPNRHGYTCIFSQIAPVRHGHARAFNMENLGCYGSFLPFGFDIELTDDVKNYICNVEKVKKSHEHVESMYRHRPPRKAPGRYLVFKRWDTLEAEDDPQVVIFFATPDVVAGLHGLANFDTMPPHGVIVPFCNACDAIVGYPLAQLEAEEPAAVLGRRRPVGQDLLQAEHVHLRGPLADLPAHAREPRGLVRRHRRVGQGKVQDAAQAVAPRPCARRAGGVHLFLPGRRAGTPPPPAGARGEATMVENPFETAADRYDRWFDSPRGRAIFEHEVACLRDLVGAFPGRWLEVGVGTGRFAEALGIREGIDPSPAVLALAARRGIETRVGRAESLPLPDASRDGLLLVVTICFVEDPAATFRECRRVLVPGGHLVVGLVPADSAWGEFYAREGREGHPFYSSARFYTADEILSLARAAGFRLARARSCLLTPPRQAPDDPASGIEDGIVPGAGFLAIDFEAERTNAPGREPPGR